MIPVRLTVDKNSMLQESEIHFEVLQEYSSGARGERIILGHVKLNLAEYVEPDGAEGGEEGTTRRYLMQDSRINSTLKVRMFGGKRWICWEGSMNAELFARSQLP